jgi:ADP-ribosylglycohydrolase
MSGTQSSGLVEPNDLPGILAECETGRPSGLFRPLALEEATRRVGAAFLARLCGCMLGKPVEGFADYERLKAAAEKAGEWPLRDYITEALLDALGGRHPSWNETVRERLTSVASDDDINYTLLAMTVMEEHGLDFTREDLRRAWLVNLPPGWTWGPERIFLVNAAAATLNGNDDAVPVGEATMDTWAANVKSDAAHCGAAIRADAWGYACLGNPGRAAELAWRDAGMTHRGTGIYGAMFLAAAIAAMPVAREPMEAFSVALQFVPRRSMFHRIASDCLGIVSDSSDWVTAYRRIHGAYGAYGFCRVHQEVGTLMNTLRFAHDTGEGICIQVSQGNDTDSFGATAGSLLGAWFGPDGLDPRWTRPFGNRIRAALATFHEQDLARVVQRMSALPRLTLAR